MQKPSSFRSPVHKQKLLLSLLCLMLAACSSAKTGAAGLTPASTEPQKVTALPVVSTSAPAPTLASAPANQFPDLSKTTGLVMLAMGDGLNTHLFAYGPDSIGMTRLTNGNWDDEDPAFSPDGTKIAFTSDRDGEWDIYILDLQTAILQRVTQSKAYDGSPAWSPDGKYLIYQTLNGKNIDLMIQSTADSTATPIQLTADAGDNFDPAWSPDGRSIAFITNRNGKNELWLADLQATSERFKVLLATDEAQYRYPRWSPDGATLAWCKIAAEESIEVMKPADANAHAEEIGPGCHPVWSADGAIMMATLDEPNSTALIAYHTQEKTLSLAPMQTKTEIESFDWLDVQKIKALSTFLHAVSYPDPAALFTPKLTLPASPTGRKGVVKLNDVTAPQPYLADSSDEAFDALRQGIGQKSGWDFLASLNNAYLSMTATDAPAITEDWLFTGRAIAVNTVPIDAGWMTISREDFNGKTYWRVWIKCLVQDGSCGKPLLTNVWDFSSRFDSDPIAYEEGGKLIAPPDGYWIDFTEFANRYGWLRTASQADWRYYYPGILFNQFVFTQGLSWQEAMLEIYPADTIQTLLTTGK
jgi:Periplasmic component of the Tol biopolymer transport system